MCSKQVIGYAARVAALINFSIRTCGRVPRAEAGLGVDLSSVPGSASFILEVIE